MNYTKEQFNKDLNNRDAPHSKSLAGARNFYEVLGTLAVQEQQKYMAERMDFVKPKGKMLELGCHNGFNLIHYAKLGFDMLGIDISGSLLKYAKQRMDKETPEVRSRIRLKRIEIENFVTPERFETIILTEILEHVIDPLKILKKANYLLKVGGKIYIANPSILVGNASHLRGINKQQMQELFDKCHLRGKIWEEGERCFAIAEVKHEFSNELYQHNQVEGFVPISKSFFKDYSEAQLKSLFCVKALPFKKEGFYLNEQLVRQGDYIVLDKSKTPKNNDFVFINQSVRKLIKMPGYWCLQIMSDPKCSPIILSEEDLNTIQGVVVKIFTMPEKIDN